MVVVEPKPSYNMEMGADQGIARGAQWSYPRMPLQCKVINCLKVPFVLKHVACMYAANTSDKERMRTVLDAVPPVDIASESELQPALGASQEGGGGNADG